MVFCARISYFFLLIDQVSRKTFFQRVDVDNRTCQKRVTRNVEVVFLSFLLPFGIDPVMNSNFTL